MMENEYEKSIKNVNMATRYENDLNFKVDLVNVLKEIRDELKKDSYVNIKPSTINITTGEINEETISNVKALIESQRKNISDSLKKIGIGRNPLDYSI